MAEETKQIQYDIDGFDVITSALMELVNQFPGLQLGDAEISFSTLGEDYGIAVFPTSGAVIDSQKESITGHVTQVCRYPFCVVYRAANLSESRKAAVKEWLDNLGRWLELQEITINGEKSRLTEYPTLTGNREIQLIIRQSPGYLDSINENQSENWLINIAVKYRNEYDI
jgi:hypothetical protein